MRHTAHADTRPTEQPSGDLDKWFDLSLLVFSGGAILAVVTWIESALVG